MNLPDAPIPHEGFFATHFFTVSDQDKSKDFHVRILGGKLIKPDNPCYIKLANTWIVLNSGGGPTPDKPKVLLETPSDHAFPSHLHKAIWAKACTLRLLANRSRLSEGIRPSTGHDLRSLKTEQDALNGRVAASGASGSHRNWRLRKAYVRSWASVAASAL